MGRADEVEALANECAAMWTYIGGHLIEVGERRGGLASLDLERTERALRAYADLLRDTRPRFAGGARSQEDENDRCAPLVEFVQRRIDRCQHCDGRGERAEEADYTGRIRYEDCIWCAGAREAMRAHRERSGDGA